jgi:hypothetical protein
VVTDPDHDRTDPVTALGDGFSHLQAAAREMVAAARSFLDAVEELVEDDDRFGQAVGQVTDLVREASSSLARLGRVVERPASHGDSPEPNGDQPPRRRRIIVE